MAFERTSLVGALAFFAFVGGFLLVAPQVFYSTIPGVAASGPLNVHFLRDVGIAYAVLAASLAYALAKPQAAAFATCLTACYLDGHAILHLTTASANAGVVVPALAMTAIATRFLQKSGSRQRVF